MRFVRPLLIMAVGIFLGFAFGRFTAPKPDAPRLSVDCYDSKGDLAADDWGKEFGAVTIGCPDGQYPRLHQPNPPKHIIIH